MMGVVDRKGGIFWRPDNDIEYFAIDMLDVLLNAPKMFKKDEEEILT